MKKKLVSIRSQVIIQIQSVKDKKSLDKIRVDILGRKGKISQILKEIPNFPKSERPKIGKLTNDLKKELETLISQKEKELKFSGKGKGLLLDITQPGIKQERGHLHPLTQIRKEIEDIFTSMGYLIYTGHEIVTDYQNYDSLNFKKDHPARDIMDTYWISDKTMPRSHTSSMQVEIMKKYGAEVKAIVPGRCYRHEATDASHETVFYQVEGLVVGKKINLKNLKATQKTVLSKIFGQEVNVRLRPGYFPFVEPGFELDMKCVLCKGRGCSACKRTGWIELIPCGMVHPNVIKNGGLDPTIYTGFAFAIGLDRLAMMRYEIEDVRHFHSGDLRFLNQF